MLVLFVHSFRSFQVTGKEKVQVFLPEFLADVNRLVTGYSNRTLANYLMWSHAEAWLYLTDKTVRQKRRERIADVMTHLTEVTTPVASDQDDCLDHATAFFSQVAIDR